MSMEAPKENMSLDQEVLRNQVESLIDGLEDAVETLKATSNEALALAERDLHLGQNTAEELDHVPSKYVRKSKVNTKTEKLLTKTDTAKQEIDDLAGSIGATLELLKTVVEGEHQNSTTGTGNNVTDKEH